MAEGAHLAGGGVLSDEAKEGNHGEAAVLDLVLLRAATKQIKKSLV